MRKLLLPTLTLVSIFFAVMLIDKLLVQQAYLDHRDAAKSRLSELTSRLSSVVTQRLQLTQGLSAFVRSRSDFTQTEFDLFAGSAGEHVTGILALQLAPDAVVRYTTDMARNASTVGHDLLADPKRRPAVQRSIATRQMVISGPVKLIQGGRAVIARNPIFVEHGDDERFWGFATVLLDVGQLFLDAGLTRSDDDIMIAVRGADARGPRGEVFFGDSDVFEMDPVVASVPLPGGSWQVGVALVEHNPWSLQRLLLWCLFAFIAPLVFWSLYRLEREPEILKERISEATVELQNAYGRAEAASKAKSDFLANMSHELRTPLNAIMGFNSLIADNSSDPESRHYAGQALASSQHLLSLVNDILDVTRIEEVGVEIDSKPFALKGLLQVVEANLKALIANKPIDIVLETDSRIPDNLEGDSLRLTQVLMNFASNAAKFTDSGQIRLVSRCVSNDRVTVRLQLLVEDTGRGIPAEKLKTVFDKFQQVDSSDTRDHGGTGLGLSICQSLIEAMDGKLIVSSEEGKGSCFGLEVDLPVALRGETDQAMAELAVASGGKTTDGVAGEPAEASAGIVARSLSQATPSRTLLPDNDRAPLPLQGIHILVVDDNAVNLKVAYEILIRQGAEVSCVENGQKAVDFLIVDREFVDVVLMDVRMPVMGGLEATTELRKHYNYEGPIIGLSANTSEDDVRASLDVGMNDHICKPFNREELVSVIRKQLGYLA